MAYTDHLLVVFGGTFTQGGDTEIWQCGIRCDFTGIWTPAVHNAWLADRGAAIATWFSAATSGMRNDAAMTYVKANFVGPDGKYSDPTGSYVRSYSAVGGNAPTGPTLLMNAMSWKTANVRGPGSNGRIYPPNALTATAAGRDRITSANNALNANAGAALIRIINTAVGAVSATACVASKKNGALVPITSCRSGDVYDVQRRRKDALRETYAVTAI